MCFFSWSKKNCVREGFWILPYSYTGLHNGISISLTCQMQSSRNNPKTVWIQIIVQTVCCMDSTLVSLWPEAETRVILSIFKWYKRKYNRGHILFPLLGILGQFIYPRRRKRPIFLRGTASSTLLWRWISIRCTTRHRHKLKSKHTHTHTHHALYLYAVLSGPRGVSLLQWIQVVINMFC